MPILMQPLDPKDKAEWPEVLNDRKMLRPDPAVYAVLHDKEVGRLNGASRILYVGSTGELGGHSDRCRLRTYRYAGTNQTRELRRSLDLVLSTGAKLVFVWRYSATEDDARRQESAVLAAYLRAHWELPPLNRRA